MTEPTIAPLVSDSGSEPRHRLVRLLKLAIVLVLLAIPLRIVALGWMPRDDVRRHAAKAVAGREWSEIVLLRPEARVDLHPGWHALLELAHRAGAETPRALAMLSIVALAALFLVAPTSWFRRAEAWVMALLAVALFEPSFFPRLLSGRPLVLAMGVLTLLLLDWRRFQPQRGVAIRHHRLDPALRAGLLGARQLVPLAAAARRLLSRRRAARRAAHRRLLGGGNPRRRGSHRASDRLPLAVDRDRLPGRSDRTTRCGSSRPNSSPDRGPPPSCSRCSTLIAIRRGAGERSWFADPVFLLALAGWVLGLAVVRFWSDWGLPALLVWGAREIEAELERRPLRLKAELLVAGFATLALFLSLTGNRGDRWSRDEEGRHLRYDDAAIRPWLPDAGGILYANSMGIFYDTFFENPRAPFRYAVGFEPGLMPPDDLAIFREISRQGGADAAFLPWVAKLTPADRIAVVRPGGPRPAIPGLEWTEAFSGLWLGKKSAPPPATPSGP